jgi:hypothetical protein
MFNNHLIFLWEVIYYKFLRKKIKSTNTSFWTTNIKTIYVGTNSLLIICSNTINIPTKREKQTGDLNKNSGKKKVALTYYVLVIVLGVCCK